MKIFPHVRALLSRSCVRMMIYRSVIMLDRIYSPLPLQWAHACMLVPADGSRVFVSFFSAYFLKRSNAWPRHEWLSVLNHWLWTLYTFKNQWYLFALLTNNYFCLLQCVCVKKYTILCVFCDFYCLSLFCGQQHMQNKRKNWKNKARTILIRKRVSKGNAEWYCDHNDVNNVTFCVSWFCTPFAVSCVHVMANKTCTYTKSGKTRQRLLFFANGFHTVVHDDIVLMLTPVFIPVSCSIFC